MRDSVIDAGSNMRLGRVELGLASFVAVFGLAAGRAYPHWQGAFTVVCPAWAIFGIPCPTCGATRAVAAVMTGDLADAVGWNPLAAIGALVTILLVPYLIAACVGIIKAPRVPTALGSTARASIVAALALNWAYLLATFSG